jgi:hypothetical protein
MWTYFKKFTAWLVRILMLFKYLLSMFLWCAISCLDSHICDLLMFLKCFIMSICSLITSPFRHPTSCKIYMSELSNYLLVCQLYLECFYGCTHVGGAPHIDIATKTHSLFHFVKNSNVLSSLTKKGEIESAPRHPCGFWMSDDKPLEN